MRRNYLFTSAGLDIHFWAVGATELDIPLAVSAQSSGIAQLRVFADAGHFGAAGFSFGGATCSGSALSRRIPDYPCWEPCRHGTTQHGFAHSPSQQSTATFSLRARTHRLAPAVPEAA